MWTRNGNCCSAVCSADSWKLSATQSSALCHAVHEARFLAACFMSAETEAEAPAGANGEAEALSEEAADPAGVNSADMADSVEAKAALLADSANGIC